MISSRIIILTVAAASLTACASSRDFGATTRSDASPLGYVGPVLAAETDTENTPVMSIAEIAEDTADTGIGELRNFEDTVWQLAEPEQVPAESTISARSTISLL